MSLTTLRRAIAAKADPGRAKVLQTFFKTGPGQYGEGDIFLGIDVPTSRAIARKFYGEPLETLAQLLASKKHEERLIALIILVHQFQTSDSLGQTVIYTFYLAHTSGINNWDLVDTSADKIVGAYVFQKSKTVLFKLVKSKNVWERRIAIVATLYFIRNNHCDTTLQLAEALLRDKHDLLHKATGWMLREVGKRDAATLRKFLDKHAPAMPRTMLRYAIERFDPLVRKKYLAIKKPQN